MRIEERAIQRNRMEHDINEPFMFLVKEWQNHSLDQHQAKDSIDQAQSLLAQAESLSH